MINYTNEIVTHYMSKSGLNEQYFGIIVNQDYNYSSYPYRTIKYYKEWEKCLSFIDNIDYKKLIKVFKYFSELIINKNTYHTLNDEIKKLETTTNEYINLLSEYCMDNDNFDKLMIDNNLLTRNELERLEYKSESYFNEIYKISKFLMTKFDLNRDESSQMM